MRLKRILEESQASGTLVSVDVQPSYEDSISFSVFEYCSFINQSQFDEIHFLYNGYETLGMDRESEYQRWLLENGLSRDIISRAYFYDKSYAYFRYCMDMGYTGQELVKLVRWMWKKDIRDSRNVDSEEWPDHVDEDLINIVNKSDDPLLVPELMDYANKNISGSISLCGGGVKECLKEVEIALLALNKTYNISHKWTY